MGILLGRFRRLWNLFFSSSSFLGIREGRVYVNRITLKVPEDAKRTTAKTVASNGGG